MSQRKSNKRRRIQLDDPELQAIDDEWAAEDSSEEESVESLETPPPRWVQHMESLGFRGDPNFWKQIWAASEDERRRRVNRSPEQKREEEEAAEALRPKRCALNASPECTKERSNITQRYAYKKDENNPDSAIPVCSSCMNLPQVREEWKRHTTHGGFFFSKKKTRKRKKKTKRKKKKKRRSRKKKKKTRKKKEAKKKDRKFTDTSYPYRMISKKEAIDDFLSLREMVKKKDFNSKSVLGNRAVDYGTEKARKKTKYRNKSHYERWQDKVAREKVLKFAKRLYNQKYKRSVDSSIRGAIELQWGSINTMRPAAAACAYKKNKATKVLDFTAGWGARLIAAMALDIDYTGIDANKALKPGYDKIIKTLRPYSKSKVKMIFKKAETVDISKLKYDFVFTSPPYEYLEVYENMENYEKKGEKVSQPYSSSKIKIDDSEKFYDEFMIPTLKEIYKYLPKGKYICLNMPDIMYTKIKKKWKKMDKKDVYSIVGRVGGPEDFKRMEKEQIFCWKKH